MQTTPPTRPVMDVTARRPSIPASPAAPRPQPSLSPSSVDSTPEPKPVMEPTPPAAVAPSTVPVHEPPKDPDRSAQSSIPPASSTASQPEVVARQPLKEEYLAPDTTPDLTTIKQPSTTPVGAIVMAILVMLILAAIAVAVYLQA